MVEGNPQPRLAFTTSGDANKPPLMLLHGFMSCNAQWLTNSAALSEHFYLVMVELWGHGDSPTPLDPAQYSVAAYLHEFEFIRNSLNLPKLGVIGQSYGAGLMIHYALNHPEVCVGVTATNSRSAFGRLTSELQPATKTQPKPQQDFDPRALPYHPIHARRFPRAVKDEMVAKADQMSPDAVRLGGLLGRTLYCGSRLGELQCPLLITNGKFEKSFQGELALLAESYPKVQVAHLDGGHSVNIEAADGFNAATTDFFQAAFADFSKTQI